MTKVYLKRELKELHKKRTQLEKELDETYQKEIELLSKLNPKKVEFIQR